MKIESHACTLSVSDFDASMKWYVDVLGFTEEFRFGNYGGLSRDQCFIHLTLAGQSHAGPCGGGRMYIICDEVDDYQKLVAGKGANILFAPKDEPYGLRDFAVADPDGNILNFGKLLRG